MKSNLILIFLLLCGLTFAQPAEKLSTEELPGAIKQYYQDLNLINSFSTPSEKLHLTNYLYTKDTNRAPNSKRLAYVLKLLEDVKNQEYVSATTMPNKFNSAPASSSFLHVVQYWFKDHEFISVRLKLYQLDAEDNLKIINLYDEENNSIVLDGEIEQLTTPQYFTDEYHEWIFINDQWLKKGLRKVLVH